MFRLICIIIGYAIGCIQVAYILGKVFGGIDIREHGSGNAGTTNVVRVLGPKIGILVFLLDILKGMAGFVICAVIFNGSGAYFSGDAGLLPGIYGGLGVILGHDFPVQLKGRGGKGSASTLGVIFWTDWRVAILCYISGFISVGLTRYISLASMVIAMLNPPLLALFGYPLEAVGISAAIAALSLYQHRENIKRIINGNERRFNFRKQPE